MAPRAWARITGEVRLLADPWTSAAAYVLLAGGLMAGIFVPELRLLTGAVGCVVLAAFVLRLDEAHDAVDLASVLALLLLAIGSLFSTQPRVSGELVWFGLVIVATFVLLRRAFASAPDRDRLLRVGARVAVGVSVVVAVLWIWESVQWPLDGGPGTLPPTGIDYSDDWLRNVNVIPIYLALLAPGLAYSWSIRSERLLAPIGLLAAAVVTVLSASRAAWLGIAAGVVVAAVLILRRHGLRLRGRGARAALAPVALLVVVATVSGLAGSLLDRVADLATLEQRGEIWDAALETWRDHPLTGAGLGTITGELLFHGLTSSGTLPAPHAHSIPIQVLAEAGTLGAAAAAVVVAGVGWYLARARSTQGGARADQPPGTARLVAIGALVAFGIDGLADNHTALAAIDLLVVANLALLLPAGAARSRRPRIWRVGRGVLTVLLIVATAGVGLWAVAAVAWGRSQAAIQAGDRASSIGSLELASALDPGFGLYARELGKLVLADGDKERGIALLAASASRNAGDPNPMRALGVVALRDGRIDEAEGYLRASIGLDASRTPSRILLGMALDAAGRADEADREYATVIAAAPLLALSDGWRAIGVPSSRLTAIADEALGMVATDPAARFQHAQLLSVLGRRTELSELLETADVPAGASLLAVAEAEAGNEAEARRLLETSSADGRRYTPYWTNRAQVMALLGDQAEVDRSYRFALRLNEAVEAATGDPRLTPAIGRESNDFWMYQRSTAWFEDGDAPQLPDAARGVWLRVHEPARIELERLVGD